MSKIAEQPECASMNVQACLCEDRDWRPAVSAPLERGVRLNRGTNFLPADGHGRLVGFVLARAQRGAADFQSHGDDALTALRVWPVAHAQQLAAKLRGTALGAGLAGRPLPGDGQRVRPADGRLRRAVVVGRGNCLVFGVRSPRPSTCCCARAWAGAGVGAGVGVGVGTWVGLAWFGPPSPGHGRAGQAFGAAAALVHAGSL